jgi:hypothetical protein
MKTLVTLEPKDFQPGTPGGDLLERLQREIEERKAFELRQRTADTLDAERYRYLRSVAGQWGGDECGPMVCSGCGDNFDFLRGVEVDAEVDEAMAAWKAAGSPIPKETQ